MYRDDYIDVSAKEVKRRGKTEQKKETSPELPKWVAKPLAWFFEWLLYVVVFIVFDNADLTTAMQAGIMLLLLIRLFVWYFGSKK